VSGPVAVDAGPFDLRPVSAQDTSAVLCLHGLTGTPYEVRPLGEALCARGFRAQGVLLPGHGASVEMLARLEHGAWVDAVRAAYRRLADEHARVHVLGMSLGGLLALNLAADEPVASVVSIGAPLKFAWPLPLLIGLLKRIKPMLEKKTGSDIRDPIARARHPGYRHMPLASVHALIRLQAEVDAKLGRIDAPAFVGHGALDETARPVDADSIYAALGSTHKRIEIYADSGHVVPVDHDGAALAQAVAEFVAEVD
jgi:carboxylesterase